MDSTRLSYAEVVKFKHNDMNDLEDKLNRLPEEQAKLIVVDGVFSMEGDMSNVPEIVRLAKKYGVRVMVDDAHGVGVMGKNGRGTCEHFNVIDEVDLIMTTFSKSFASLGGYVVGDRKIIEYIRHQARSLMFSASITPASLGAAQKALEIIQTQPWRRERLWEITKFMNKELVTMGYHTGNTESAIVPVFIRDVEKTFKLWHFLREFGIFTNPVIAPAVPPEDSLIRTSFTATHTDEDLEFILKGFYEGGKTFGLIG
jgi:7-keto-8-aminopelargonate synthetase-like enzyme